MSKKLLFFSSIVSLLSAHAFANTEPAADVTRFLFSDTTGQQSDSFSKPAPTLTDPKEGFKNLFISSDEPDGISMEQLNPQAVGFIADYITRYGKTMEGLKVSGKPYFDMMDEVLTLHGLPTQLKYLAVIESYLNINARSWAGAVGPWQFMPATARNMGLKVTRKVDERKDVFKSTHAASRYLSTLFDMYGDWLLVIAAYNGGPGRVNSAIQRSGSRDFWQLQNYLPAESRNHVKKFIATHYIMEGEGGITTLTKTEAGILLPANSVAVTAPAPADAASSLQISGRYNASVIARHLSMDLLAFYRINPDFDKMIANNGQYELRLPTAKMDTFRAKKNEILSESVELLLNPSAAVSKKPAGQNL
ncbi:MAG: lytic transglycosylase domain-containing protein [Chitinophagaceae bacterium]